MYTRICSHYSTRLGCATTIIPQDSRLQVSYFVDNQNGLLQSISNIIVCPYTCYYSSFFLCLFLLLTKGKLPPDCEDQILLDPSITLGFWIHMKKLPLCRGGGAQNALPEFPRRVCIIRIQVHKATRHRRPLRGLLHPGLDGSLLQRAQDSKLELARFLPEFPV